MKDNPTREEVLASIVPKSDQLNSEDLIGTGPVTVTVAGVRRGSKEQPIQIDLVERDRPFRPCKTVRRLLIALWTDDPKKWVGKQLTIYTDPDVLYAGVRVGGLRVSHASGIDNPRTLMLSVSKGKKSEITVHPIADEQPKAAGSKDDYEMLLQYVADGTSETRMDQIAAMVENYRWQPSTAKKIADAIEARRIELVNQAANEVD